MKEVTELKRETKVARPVPKVQVGRVLLSVLGGTLLLLLLLASYRFYRLSPQYLYQQAFVKHQLPQEGDYELGATKIEMAYRANDFDSVIRQSKRKQPFTDQDYLLIGLSYMQVKDFAAAIEPLRLLIRWKESDYKEEGEFYLALAYLRNKDYDHSLELMERIHNTPTHAFYQQVPGKLIRNVRILKWR